MNERFNDTIYEYNEKRTLGGRNVFVLLRLSFRRRNVYVSRTPALSPSHQHTADVHSSWLIASSV